MARGINKIILIGNIGQEPEKVGDNNITRISVATTDSWKDKQTGEQKEKTEWHRVTFFGHLANSALKYLYKGAKVYIEGSNSTHKWEKDGQTHYTTEIHVREYRLLSELRNQPDDQPAQQSGTSHASRANADRVAQQQDDAFDDDIPF